MARVQGEQPEKASPFILAPAEFAATAMKRFEAFARAQAERSKRPTGNALTAYRQRQI